MLKKLEEEYDKLGLTINTDKTEHIVVASDFHDINISKDVVNGIYCCKYFAKRGSWV